MNYNIYVYFTLTSNITTPLLSPIKHPSNYISSQYKITLTIFKQPTLLSHHSPPLYNRINYNFHFTLT